MTDSLETGLQQVAGTLQSLAIPFLVGGALASSAHGIPRATFNADVLVDLLPEQADRLADALGSDWHTEGIGPSLRAGGEFHLVRVPTAACIHLFRAATAFHRSELARARSLGGVPFASVEDILLAKLQWYRDGRGFSDSQWMDIGGVLAMNAGMDWQYVAEWAATLGVSDLLERARADVEK